MVNDLMPTREKLDEKTLTKFLEFFDTTFISGREKGPDYVVIDNFLEYFNLEEEDLQGAKSEAEQLTKAGCESVNEYENQGARCDTLMWLEGLKNEG